MDIKTIFYFADNQAEYESNLDNISSRTIVFVQDTGAIYKGGKLFGKMSEDDIKTILLKIYRDDPTSFPTYSTISDLAGLFSNFKTDTNATIENITNTVSSIYNYEESDIANIAANTIATSQWLKDYIENNPSTSVLKLSDFSTYANSWASGYIIPQANGLNGLTFALLLAAHNALSLSVSNIKTGVQNSNGVDITTIEQLKSTFDSWLESSEELGDLDTAVTQIRSMWALTLDEDTQNALSWMSSSFKASASRTNTFAEVLASASDGAITSAISGLRTEISTDQDGIVSNALSTQLSNIDGAISSLTTSVETLQGVNVVTTSMISSITDSEGKITAASIIANVNDSGSSVMLSADKILLDGTTFFLRLISEFDDKKITIGNGVLEVESENLMSVRKWVHPSGDGAQFVPQLISLGEKIKIDGERIYNDPLTSYSNSDQSVVYKNPKWNIGYDLRWLESIGTLDIPENRILALDKEAIDNSGQIEVITLGSDEDANHIYSIKSDDYYVISTENGLDQDGNDIPASVYVDGNLHVNGNATVSELNTYNGSGVSNTIDIPSTTSGKHYHMVIDCGIIIECNEVSDQ